MTDESSAVVEQLRYCPECEGKTLHTNRPRDSDDGKVRCQWCGTHTEVDDAE